MIARRFGPEYVPERPPVYARKAKGAQEAHEAIRPTAPQRDPESVKPFLSSAAVPALPADLAALHRQPDAAGDPRRDDGSTSPPGDRADFAPAGEPPYLFRATGSVVRFPGSWRSTRPAATRATRPTSWTRARCRRLAAGEDARPACG